MDNKGIVEILMAFIGSNRNIPSNLISRINNAIMWHKTPVLIMQNLDDKNVPIAISFEKIYSEYLNRNGMMLSDYYILKRNSPLFMGYFMRYLRELIEMQEYSIQAGYHQTYFWEAVINTNGEITNIDPDSTDYEKLIEQNGNGYRVANKIQFGYEQAD